MAAQHHNSPVCMAFSSLKKKYKTCPTLPLNPSFFFFIRIHFWTSSVKQKTNNQNAFHHRSDQGSPDLHQLQQLLRCHVNWPTWYAKRRAPALEAGKREGDLFLSLPWTSIFTLFGCISTFSSAPNDNKSSSCERTGVDLDGFELLSTRLKPHRFSSLLSHEINATLLSQ